MSATAWHVRAGDIWAEQGSGGGNGGVNAAAPAFAPPPVWWYEALAKREGLRFAWAVCERHNSSLGVPRGAL